MIGFRNNKGKRQFTARLIAKVSTFPGMKPQIRLHCQKHRTEIALTAADVPRDERLLYKIVPKGHGITILYPKDLPSNDRIYVLLFR